jgi:hypothetical protein
MNDFYSENNEQVNQSEEETQTENSRLEEKFQVHEQTTTSELMESVQTSCLSDEEIEELQSRWDSIQIEFVDEPQASVEKADALISGVLERIEQSLSNQRTSLNEQWDSRQDRSTEDLRVVLQNYRSFLNRLLEL